MCSTIEYKEKRRIIHKKYFVYGALIHILQQANLVAEGFFLDKNSTVSGNFFKLTPSNCQAVQQ